MRTVEKTRSTNKIYIGKDLLEKLIREERKKRLIGLFETLKERFYEIADEEWVKIKNKDVYYVKKYSMLVPDTKRKACSRERFEPEFAGYKGRLLSYDEAKDLFYKNRNRNPLVENNEIINDKEKIFYISYYENSIGAMRISDGSTYIWGESDSDYIKVPVYICDKLISKLELFIQEHLIPSDFKEDESAWFNRLSSLYQEKYLGFSSEGDYTFSESLIDEPFISEVLSGKHEEFNGVSFRKADIIEYLKNEKVEFIEDIRKVFVEKYLNADYLRAEIDPYDFKMMEDIGRGHWELWPGEDEKGVLIEISEKFVARNPLADIQEDGIVGIDFGTKSTVVVYQNSNSNIWPMRIGSGNYKKETQIEDYENPTVMEFKNIEDFMARYQERKGRPETLWEDLTVSHKAAEQLKSQNDSSKFYSFFSELKQWCGDKNRRIRIMDNQGHEEEMSGFLDIKEGEVNPIELYAYYLGLYINNMRQKIYLNYIMSFPVTYEKAVKEKIIESFEKGIKKSLPDPVLEDKECMDGFSVRQWSSEPAAYAICALKEYGFQPDEGERVFYGIFDFGGGTTDFDFGIWKSAGLKQRRRYDYVIQHFGAGGDQYLGGEHLLEMLAYHVFKENRTTLLRAGIPFYKPHDCENFVGSEDLLCDSQEARLNIKQLMEKLRGVWQNDNEEAINEIEEGKVQILLFTKEGKLEPNFELNVNRQELQTLLYTRIEQGIKNFFTAMMQAFTEADLRDAEGVNIFLAGNSSKSDIVKELFEQYSKVWTKKITEKLKQESLKEDTPSFFHIFPPLGTEEALTIQGELEDKLEKKEDDFTRPTGKTGVAYGLILGKPGSRIRVISEISNEKEAKFKYYIGYNEREYFCTVIDRDIEYRKWIYFIDAFEADFEFYYTSLPEEALNRSSISGINKKLCRIEKANEDEKIGVYIRAIEPSAIEYAVASEDGIEKEEFIEKPKRVDLL